MFYGNRGGGLLIEGTLGGVMKYSRWTFGGVAVKHRSKKFFYVRKYVAENNSFILENMWLSNIAHVSHELDKNLDFVIKERRKPYSITQHPGSRGHTGDI